MVSKNPRKLSYHSSEQAIHKAVVAHLMVRKTPGVFFWHTPNGGFRRPIEGAIFKSLGVVPGIPDLLLLHEASLYALELKSATGKPSHSQIAAAMALASAGATVGVAFSLDEAIGQLESWGLLR